MTDSDPQANGAPAAQPAAAPPAAAPSPEELLAAAEAKAAEHWSACLRAVAELDNYRKRAAREIEGARQYGAERLATELLPVLDSLGLALDAAAADAATLLEGQRATLRLLLKAFERAGISEIDPLGQPFDPQLHEAMALQPAAGQPPDTVLQVAQKGYVLNGRLLRPARVIVARAPDPPAGG
ncbi:MAG: nucleotide exchange factor GrpE [Gammaproteobacteria bacterium]|nr:nucleotide exchange factor GrpE [Gammaproteobacteria bacterium]